MSRRTHGLISLFLFDVACWIGVIAAFLHSVTAGLVCGTAMGIGTMMLLFSFCANCPCKGNSCAHMLPGKAAGMLAYRRISAYRTSELLLAGFGGLLIIVVPQAWLLGRPILLSVYWVLICLAVFEIRIWVCPGCTHRCCPLNTKIK